MYNIEYLMYNGLLVKWNLKGPGNHVAFSRSLRDEQGCRIQVWNLIQEAVPFKQLRDLHLPSIVCFIY